MKFNIAICDDEVLQVDIVEKLILETVQQINKTVNILKFFSGEDLVKYCKTDDKLHIIFLDMEMDGIDGIECAKKIREKNENVIIIFVTGYKEYVFDVFEINTFRYLLKPVKKDQFQKALIAAIKSIKHRKAPKKQNEVLVINKNKEKIIIAYNSINYFEKYKNKVMVNCDKQNIEFYGTFNELNTLLDINKFIRVHQGYIANIDKIEVITSKEVYMKNGQKLPVSRRNAKEVKEVFLSYKRVKS
ncbi:DNA-binding response regulator [Vallitalea longa]|uniref:Stage 0 sporulation protein A homolog n=1 Tax=Vallitalea longa TaxID=2936439 RepID=A0A9W5Y7R7_9FIRM|nr:LytTR family DNA-binding domain-containing protein [Vallitalea longa]GKX28537.1 DNA-binding response regulator [Vallitalea longa]